MSTPIQIAMVAVGLIIAAVVIYVLLISLFYRKVKQGKALVRTGYGAIKVAFKGMWVVPLLHESETMDISLRQLVISREGKDGLICKDNLRADIKVAFFVRVNPTDNDVRKVAQTIGCARASDPELLNTLFEAKFSEALKTVGKQFDFVNLYNSREEFRQQIVDLIGRDLNGYILDDAAIDYLEQTPIEYLDEDNILDAEGIKKIRDLTAKQITLANKIQREKEKELKKQDVEAHEAILELEKQDTEKVEIQQREIAAIRAREIAEAKRVQEEELLKSEAARIEREREVEVQTQNKMRDVIVASKNKERTEAIEQERLEKERDLEATERERIVTIAQIEKERAVEEERKNIQDVIRDRVAVEREVVEEQERIKDTQADSQAAREKRVAIMAAEQKAEESLVQRIKAAEADANAATLEAQKRITEANATREAVDKEAEAKKIMADAVATEHAALGLAEAQVMEAKAQAREKEGEAEAHVLEQQAIADAKGIEMRGESQAQANRQIGLAEAEIIQVRADADKKLGLAQAVVIAEKGAAEAKGTAEKAKAMKQLDGVGKEHEEFKLRLEKERAIDLAEIDVRREIAAAQAQVIAEALKSANIDIVGGEQQFFDKITSAITNSKYVDRIMQSEHLGDVKEALLVGGKGDIGDRIRELTGRFGITADEIQKLSVSALIGQMMSRASANEQGFLGQLLGAAQSMGFADKKAAEFL